MKDIEGLKKRISTSNEAGLIVILLERMIGNCQACIKAITDDDQDKLEVLNDNTRAILTELTVQFSGDDEVSSTLRELNLYINKMITEGQTKGQAYPYEISIRVMRPILDGFKELELKGKPKAAVGFTYGKNNLKEYIIEEGKSFET